jgi:endonuclease/exonuclease/phosphatase family metal-dependent hydrolase
VVARRTRLRRSTRAAVAALALLLCAGCRTGLVYSGADVPVYQGGPARAPAALRGDTLRIVAFNIKYAREIDRALEVLGQPALRNADVLLLQEMDEPGTWRIAEALGMHYVYYPAVRHTRTGRDFGNAVLARWPIVEHERLLLPHRGRITQTRRTATAATLRIGERRLRVYSTHLATLVELGPGARAEQLCTIVEDAQRHAHAVIGGDLNSSTVPEAAANAGMTWPTGTGPPTSLAGRLDHILLHGLAVVPGRVGVVREVRGASDHRPVWLDVVLNP